MKELYGSFVPKTTNGGTGGVIRNNLGAWIAGFACKIKEDSTYHAELLALLHGPTLTKEKNLKRMMVETDSQVLLSSLNNNNTLYSHICADCRSLLKKLEVPPLKHIPWEANRTTDALAELGRKSKYTPMIRNYLYILDASPSSITDVLERDAIGTTSLRLVPFYMDDP